MNTYNCKTCLYANNLDSGLVMCDRRLLYDNTEIYIEADKVGKSCPCHSDRFIREWRYMRDNDDIRQADDACSICGRLYDHMNEDNYINETWEIDGRDIDMRICRICVEKGRNLIGDEEK